ncbi:transposase [Lactobacillus taiwanensis]|uniref:transposase n=1 Tax=Lactobacillus taiwanensis TaxID=508451 RepID=UPI0021C3ED87|nr:transposase [Lactobacillus taiwanensis]
MTKLNRLEIYNDWKLRYKSIDQIAFELNLNASTLRYMIKLIDRYGTEIYDKPNASFTREFKEGAIIQALTGTKTIEELSLDLGLKSNGILCNWIREYKKNGYNVVIKKKGQRSAHEPKEKQQSVTQGFREANPAARRRKLEIAYRQCLRKKQNVLGQKHQKK